MTADKGYSGPDYWDDYFAASLKSDATRRNGDRVWLNPFLPHLRAAGAKEVLDLGCGSGADALVLARQGFRTSGIDLALEALKHARGEAAREGLRLRLALADVAEPLPFAEARFDAVMCNLTLHMFPEALADGIVAEVARCLKPGGLFLLHVNATEDIPIRLAKQKPVQRLRENFYCLGKGQTMRFFSEDSCRRLLADWDLQSLALAESRDAKNEVLKIAWRCVAAKR
jgi:SAM-dependent methyltransferase